VGECAWLKVGLGRWENGEEFVGQNWDQWKRFPPNGLLFVALSLKLEKGSIFGWREVFFGEHPFWGPVFGKGDVGKP